MLVTQSASSPKAAANDPGGTEISATALSESGSMRFRVPRASVRSQTLPAPVASPPSPSAIPVGIRAVTWPVFKSTRARA